MKYGLIAGSGRFPVLALETARKLGHEVVVIAMKDNAPPEVEALAARCHWISIAELGKLIDILHAEKITEVMMAGQVKHVSLFSSLKPDWRLLKLLTSLPARNTDALIGGVQEDARRRRHPPRRFHAAAEAACWPARASLTRRKPDDDERKDIDYGRRVANALAGFDIGQSVAISERACVAVEAMEGTDAMLRRAASLVNGRPLRAGESLEPPQAPAVRRAGGRTRHHRDHAGDRSHRAGGRRRPHAAARSRTRCSSWPSRPASRSLAPTGRGRMT